MNIRPILIIAAAAAASLVTVSMVAIWLKQKNDADTMQVVVATRDIPLGTRLMPAMLETVSWPASAPIQSPLHSTDQAYDRVINMPILRGEPILASKLAALGQQGGLSSVLKEGKRAVTVKVNEVVGVAGFALPGNYVDVMANLTDRDNDPVSKIVLERIQVLAVAQDISSTENKPRVVSAVTLEVSPQEAEIIDLARSVGSLSLVLRSQIDMVSVVTTGSRKVDLLQKTAQQPAHFKALSTEPKSADGLRSVTSGATKPASLSQPSKASVKMEVIRGMTKSIESSY